MSERKSEIVRQAESKVNLIDYFNTYVVGEVEINGHRQTIRPIQKGGSSLCPLHSETDASFKVFEKNGMLLYHCFGCGAGGSVVNLYRRIEGQRRGVNLSLDESAKRLLSLYGYEKIANDALKGENPLNKALDKVKGYDKIDIPETFNLITFRQQNDKISKMSDVKYKIKQLGMLDRMLSAYVATKTDR